MYVYISEKNTLPGFLLFPFMSPYQCNRKLGQVYPTPACSRVPNAMKMDPELNVTSI
jgi:hypothetical protein